MRATAWFLSIAVSAALCGSAHGATVNAGNGFRATWEGQAIRSLSVRGKPLPGVAASFQLVDPRTKASADPAKFRVEAKLAARNGALWLDGVVVAAGTEDTVVPDLRIEGVTLPWETAGTRFCCPPGCSTSCRLHHFALRPRDDLGIGLHADRLCVAEFRALPEESGDHPLPAGQPPRSPGGCAWLPSRWSSIPPTPALAFPLGAGRLLSPLPDHPPAHRPPWRLVLCQRDEEHPQPAALRVSRGEGSVAEDHDRNMGMYPYNETGSETIQLTGLFRRTTKRRSAAWMS